MKEVCSFPWTLTATLHIVITNQKKSDHIGYLLSSQEVSRLKSHDRNILRLMVSVDNQYKMQRALFST
jgi:transcription termination factor NusB